MDDDERAWKMAMYERVVADQQVQHLAWQMAKQSIDDPTALSPGDLHAARRYLQTCVLRMTVTELGNMRPHEFAALWSRGVVGASEYRRRGSGGAAGGPTRPAK